MKSIFALAVLGLSLSLCSLGDRLANINSKGGNAESSDNQNANKSNTNGSSNEAIDAPPASEESANAEGAVSGGRLNDKATSLPQPAYPQLAKAVKASGTVIVAVTVDETGKVISANAVSGHPLLRQSAVQAAYQARFKPTMLSGRPVKVTGTITYNFEP